MFRRRTQDDATTAEPAPTDPSDVTRKGRPTPSRREAETQRRQRVRPPVDRREEARRRRARLREQRAATRAAMAAGDERAFMARDRGPVRRFVRDFVDSRRTVAEFFLPILIVIFMASLIRVPQVVNAVSLVWTMAMVLVIVDTTVMGVRLRREVRRRFPNDPGRGHVFYGIARATQLRRFRIPKPRVKPGARV